jgi:ribonucleoside-triphosphate reductase
MENRNAQTAKVKVPCEVYSRVVGYLRPVRNWNNGKKQEFTERKTFKVSSSRE